jgi:hypothetical protein
VVCRDPFIRAFLTPFRNAMAIASRKLEARIRDPQSPAAPAGGGTDT